MDERRILSILVAFVGVYLIARQDPLTAVGVFVMIWAHNLESHI